MTNYIRPYVLFNGRKYTKYYRYYTTGPHDGERYLHRAVWVDANGPIPEGHHVHHVDGDLDNNDISNLECVLAFDHLSGHGKENADQARELMNEHARPAARQRHIQNDEVMQSHKRKAAAAMWANRKMHTKHCASCGEDYETPFPTRSKYCGLTCKQRGFRARRPDYYKRK